MHDCAIHNPAVECKLLETVWGIETFSVPQTGQDEIEAATRKAQVPVAGPQKVPAAALLPCCLVALCRMCRMCVLCACCMNNS